MLDPRTFIGHCLAGRSRPDEIDDWIDRWHESDTGRDLHSYLGMTLEEYSNWAIAPDCLSHIIEIRRLVEAGKTTIARIAAESGSGTH